MKKDFDADMLKATGSPKVSVIIPSYNTAPYIGETMASVRTQTFTDYEVIVVNDGSPDTEQLERALDPYKSAIRYLRKENGGAASARNAGIQIARGHYVALLDSDDLWEPDYLAVQVATLDANPDAVLSYTNMTIFGNSSHAGLDYMSILPSEGEVTIQRLVEQQCNVTSSVLARRETLLRAGLFDESLRTAEDFDLWLRLIHQGGQLVYNRRTLWRYRKRDGSLTGAPLELWGNYLRVLEKIGRTMGLPLEDAAAVAHRAEYCRAMLSLYEGKRSFFAGDFAVAASSLEAANAHIKSRKLALAVQLMRRAPRLLLRCYEARDRFVFRTNTKL